MAADIGKARVKVEFDQDSVNAGVEQTKGGILGKFKGIGALGGLALAGGIATGAVAAGKALYGVGQTFDDVADTIRVGTGATGAALDGLVGSAQNIGRDVPANFSDIGVAVADLNTRLGLTGQPLEAMAGQFLNLSRITGTDLQANIAGITRVFGDWGIASQDQAGALDEIYRASQATGAGVDTLSQQVVQFGAPMRQLGFSFSETLALLGKFEKEGVNTNLVMGSMRIALGKMAKEGEAPVETLSRVTDQIKNAGSAGEANALALELFGARAGADMAAAIREGRFEIDSLVSTIAGGGDTINAAAADTADFAESWQLFKNNALIVIEPIAARVFDLLGRGMQMIVTVGIPAFQRVASAVAPFIASLQQGGGAMEGILPTLQKFGSQILAVVVPAVSKIGALISGSLVPAFQRFLPAVQPIITFLLNVFGTALVGAIKGVVNVVQGVVNILAGIFNVAAALLTGNWSGLWQGIKQIATGAFQAIIGAVQVFLNVGVLRLFSLGFAALRALVTGAWTVVRSLFTSGMAAAQGFVSKGIAAIVAFFRSGLTSAVGAVKGGIDTVRLMFMTGMQASLAVVRGALTSIVAFFRSQLAAAQSAVVGAVNGIRSFFSSGLNALAGIARGALSAMAAAVRAGISTAVALVRGVGGQIAAAASGFAGALRSAGANIIIGLIGGITGQVGAAVRAVKNAVGNVVSGAKAALGIRSPSKVFAEIGRQTGQGLAIGLEASNRDVDRAMGRLVRPPSIPRPGIPSSSATVGSGGASGGVVFQGPVNVFDPAELARIVTARMDERDALVPAW